MIDNVKAYKKLTKDLFFVRSMISGSYNDFTMLFHQQEDKILDDMDKIWQSCSWLEKCAIELFIKKTLFK